MKGKRGQSSALFTLAEIVLALGVLAIIGLILFGMASNSRFFQQFYAKDNAHIVEALHAVPNGEMYVGYMWNNPDYQVQLQTDRFTVYGYSKSETIPKDAKDFWMKYFGVSHDVPVTQSEIFSPQYYQYVRTHNDISIVQKFGAMTCPAGRPMQGFVPLGSEQGLPEGIAQKMMNSVHSGVNDEVHADIQKSGMTIRLYIAQGPPSIAVYHTSLTDEAIRMTCTIARATSTKDTNTPFAPAEQEPALKGMTDNIIIYVHARDEKEARSFEDSVREGIAKYWEDIQ